MANSSSSSSGVSFTGLLTISFVVMKLCKVITWSWLWVLSPLWIHAIIYLLVWGLIFLWGALVYKQASNTKKTPTLEKPKRSSFANKMEEMMKLQKDKKVIKD